MSKNIVLTGVSGGIGGAICAALLARGYTIHGCYCSAFDSSRGNSTDKPIHEEFSSYIGKTLFLYDIDFRLRDHVDAFIRNIIASDMSIVSLINNAAICKFESFSEINFDSCIETLSINLIAPILLARGLMERFAKGAMVINISSISSLYGSRLNSMYAASKAALDNASKSICRNLSEVDVQSVSLVLGYVNGTGMSTSVSELAGSVLPLRRNLTPEDVARKVTHLLEGDFEFVSGSSIVADGGLTSMDPIEVLEGLAFDVGILRR